MAPRATTTSLEFLLCKLQDRLDAFGVPDQDPARIRQDGAVPPAVNEMHTGYIFQSRDADRQCRLRDAESLGSLWKDPARSIASR